MPSDDVTQRIFDKIEDVQREVHEVRVDVAVIKENQSGMQKDITNLKNGHEAQQTVIDRGKGAQKLLAWIIGIGAVLIAGGIGVALGRALGG